MAGGRGGGLLAHSEVCRLRQLFRTPLKRWKEGSVSSPSGCWARDKSGGMPAEAEAGV